MKFEVDGSKLPRGKSIPLGEIGKSDSIDLVSENDFIKDAEMEAFMNQEIQILVHSDREKGSLDVITPMVNGVNQPIIRGRKQYIKRKYVEALARGTHTGYEQSTADANRPEQIQMNERTTICYPFTVYDDPSPYGKQWLDNILATG